jgi:DNA-binding PadR family transcriptional regulator
MRSIVIRLPTTQKNLARHTAMVPKGFLRLHVLEALNQKPMSGSELTQEIEKQTCGSWKPSPGSIYPLLSWLQNHNYVKELPNDNGLKRYELTPAGKLLRQEQEKIRKKIREEVGFLPPAAFFDNLLMKIPPQQNVAILEGMRRLAVAFFQLGHSLQENYSEQTLNQAIETVNETSKKLEEITTKNEREQMNQNNKNNPTKKGETK